MREVYALILITERSGFYQILKVFDTVEEAEDNWIEYIPAITLKYMIETIHQCNNEYVIKLELPNNKEDLLTLWKELPDDENKRCAIDFCYRGYEDTPRQTLDFIGFHMIRITRITID